MRLLNSRTYQLEEFVAAEDIPRYAILSHFWGKDEVKFQDMTDPNIEQRLGYKKIKFCCNQAIKDGLDWVWADTCCIDKTNTAELSEAINSMFSWYKNAWICYAYLSDVPEDADLSRNASDFIFSRWFTRGWTLQELLAPADVIFYSDNWRYLGSILSFCSLLTKITGIEEEQLKYRNLDSDNAYCLLGIFDISMPLLYGEGTKAFSRLQEEIMKISDDQSLFAWGLPKTPSKIDLCIDSQYAFPSTELQRITRLLGILAQSPEDFANSGTIATLPDVRQQDRSIPVAYNRGVNIRLPLLLAGDIVSGIWRTDGRPFSRLCFYEESMVFAILDCTIQGDNIHRLALPIRAWSPHYFGRFSQPVLVATTEADGVMDPEFGVGDMRTLQIKPEPSCTEFLGGKFIIHHPEGCALRVQCASSAVVFGGLPSELVSYGYIPGTHAVLILNLLGKQPFAITLGGYVRSDLGNESDLWVSYVGFSKDVSSEDVSDLFDEATDVFKRMRKEAWTSVVKQLFGNILVRVRLSDMILKFRHWVVQVNIEIKNVDRSEHM